MGLHSTTPKAMLQSRSYPSASSDEVPAVLNKFAATVTFAKRPCELAMEEVEEIEPKFNNFNTSPHYHHVRPLFSLDEEALACPVYENMVARTPLRRLSSSSNACQSSHSRMSSSPRTFALTSPAYDDTRIVTPLHHHSRGTSIQTSPSHVHRLASTPKIYTLSSPTYEDSRITTPMHHISKSGTEHPAHPLMFKPPKVCSDELLVQETGKCCSMNVESVVAPSVQVHTMDMERFLEERRAEAERQRHKAENARAHCINAAFPRTPQCVKLEKHSRGRRIQ